MYIKMEGLYGIKGRNAWYRKSGSGCFDFTSDRNRASYLTEEEAEEIEQNAEWYCKQYHAERMVIDWEDTLLDKVIHGLKYCTPDVGCHDCPYYDGAVCDCISECDILKDAVELLEQYKAEKQNKGRKEIIMQYLVEWANGAFQIVTGEQLTKDIEEYRQAPKQIYRLFRGQKPKHYRAVIMKGCWYLDDDYGNHLLIL